MDCRGVQEKGQDVVDDDCRVGGPVGACFERRGNVTTQGAFKARVFCFADKEEKEEGFEETDEEEVEGETENAAVPALAGRVGDCVV